MTSGPRPHTGAPSRTLSYADLMVEQERLRVLPASPERTAALRKVSSGLRSIANRSSRNGA